MSRAPRTAPLRAHTPAPAGAAQGWRQLLQLHVLQMWHSCRLQYLQHAKHQRQVTCQRCWLQLAGRIGQLPVLHNSTETASTALRVGTSLNNSSTETPSAANTTQLCH
jgi:hypothetical protein